MTIKLPSKRFVAILFSLVLSVVSTMVVVKNVSGVSDIPATPVSSMASKTTVAVNERFFLNWIWNTLSNPASSLTLDIHIPNGMYLNWNDACRSGNGCNVSTVLTNTHTGGQTVVTDAKALRAGNYEVVTDYVEQNGTSGRLTVNIEASELQPTPTPTPTPTPIIITPISDLRIVKEGQTIRLNWSGISGVSYFNIYRSTDPYFIPGEKDWIAKTEESTFTNSVTFDNNYYYIVKPVFGTKEGDDSNRVGVFTYVVYKTASAASYNWIATPLITKEIKTASDLAEYIRNDSNGNITVRSISYWDNSTQSFISYTSQTNITNFTIVSQNPYRIDVDIKNGNSATFTLVGDVPKAGSYSYTLRETPGTDFSWIMLPLERQDTSASQLAVDIENNASNKVKVIVVSQWIAIAQNYSNYTKLPFVIGDFKLKNGFPYRIAVDVITTDTTLWPAISLAPEATPTIVPTATPTSTPISNKISWKTPSVTLQADDFYIIAAGKKYYGKATDLTLHSDPGSSTYTTLEAMWHENGAEMRLYMYFNANNTYWWSPEIRTYNGKQPGDWITYTGGLFFKNYLGNAYNAPTWDLYKDMNNPYINSIHFANLKIQAFTNVFKLIGSRPKCTYNDIILPSSRSYLKDAESLDKDIGDVAQILVWDSTLGSSGAYRIYEPGNPFSVNFQIKVGESYKICMLESKTWPSSTVIPTATPIVTQTPSPTVTPTPTPTVSICLNPSVTSVKLELLKDYSSTSGLTMKQGFTIASCKSTTWQLYNNQDGVYTPFGGQPQPILVQGFGFYDSSGGISVGQTASVRAYVNNNRQAGLYEGSYKLQQVDQGKTTTVATIYYSLTVREPVVPTVTPTPTYTPIPTATPTPVNHNPVIYPNQNMLPIASTRRNYLTYIWVYDVDRDKVNVSISNLPAGLNYNCKDGSSTAVKTCTLSGRPAKTGWFTVSVQAKDARGGETIKKYYLMVSPKLFWWL